MEPLKYIKLDIKANYKPPYFAGSMIRGVLGRALKRVTCINPSMDCEGCFASDNCLYYRWYEDKNIYHTYRITAPLGMDRLRFSVWLYEDAINDLPYLLSSLKMALEEIGIGSRDRRRAIMIDSIKIGDKIIYSDGEFGSIKDIEAIEFTPKDIDSFKIKWNTPLRIKLNNRFVRDGESITIPMLVNSIHKRYYQLKGLTPKKLDFTSTGEIDGEWKYLELTRYSNRQKSKMKLGGLIGNQTIKGVDKQSSYYLQLGEILGVGKQTVFGLGDYNLYPLKKEVR